MSRAREKKSISCKCYDNGHSLQKFIVDCYKIIKIIKLYSILRSAANSFEACCNAHFFALADPKYRPEVKPLK